MKWHPKKKSKPVVKGPSEDVELDMKAVVHLKGTIEAKVARLKTLHQMCDSFIKEANGSRMLPMDRGALIATVKDLANKGIMVMLNINRERLLIYEQSIKNPKSISKTTVQSLNKVLIINYLAASLSLTAYFVKFCSLVDRIDNDPLLLEHAKKLISFIASSLQSYLVGTSEIDDSEGKIGKDLTQGEMTSSNLNMSSIIAEEHHSSRSGNRRRSDSDEKKENYKAMPVKARLAPATAIIYSAVKLGSAKAKWQQKIRPIYLLLAASVATLAGAVLGSVVVVALVAFGAATWKVYNWAATDNSRIIDEGNSIKDLCKNYFPGWFNPAPSAPLMH